MIAMNRSVMWKHGSALRAFFANVPDDPGQHAAYLLSQPNPSDFDRWHGPPGQQTEQQRNYADIQLMGGRFMIEQISLLTVDLIGHISCLLLCTALFRRTCAKRQLVLAFLGTLAAGLSHHRGARYQGIPDQGDSASHGVHRLLPCLL